MKVKFDLQLWQSQIVARSSSSLAFYLEDKAIIGPDFDVMILDMPFGSHHRFAVVSANECFKLDTPAIFRNPA